MFPPTFSFHETYGKRDHPDELKAIEQKNRVLESRRYRYGDPVNTGADKPGESPRSSNEAQQERKPNNVFPVLRFLRFFYSIFLHQN
jgi:hypothetical protein